MVALVCPVSTVRWRHVLEIRTLQCHQQRCCPTAVILRCPTQYRRAVTGFLTGQCQMKGQFFDSNSCWTWSRSTLKTRIRIIGAKSNNIVLRTVCVKKILTSNLLFCGSNLARISSSHSFFGSYYPWYYTILYIQSYTHRIGWWEHLQETPIFDGKNHGFL